MFACISLKLKCKSAILSILYFSDNIMICQGDNHTAFTNAMYYFKIHPLEICQTLQAYTRVGKQTSCLVYSNLFLLVHVVSLTPYDFTD